MSSKTDFTEVFRHSCGKDSLCMSQMLLVKKEQTPFLDIGVWSHLDFSAFFC